MHLGLVYEFQLKDEKETKAFIIPLPFKFIGYKDSSYVRNPMNKLLVIKYYYFITKVIVFWYSKKQKIGLI